jgi:oligoendopeptidase F
LKFDRDIATADDLGSDELFSSIQRYAQCCNSKKAIRADVAALQTSCSQCTDSQCRLGDGLEDILLRNEDLSRRMSHLGSYIGCWRRPTRATKLSKREAELTRIRAELAKCASNSYAPSRHRRQNFRCILRADTLAGAQNYLDAFARRSAPGHDGGKEILATDLGVDGIQAWGRLYDNHRPKLEFDHGLSDGRRARCRCRSVRP